MKSIKGDIKLCLQKKIPLNARRFSMIIALTDTYVKGFGTRIRLV
jgi:hypothetical protein